MEVGDAGEWWGMVVIGEEKGVGNEKWKGEKGEREREREREGQRENLISLSYLLCNFLQAIRF